jgi:hypothetical protein
VDDPGDFVGRLRCPLIFNPILGGLTLLWLVASYAIVFGTMIILPLGTGHGWQPARATAHRRRLANPVLASSASVTRRCFFLRRYNARQFLRQRVKQCLSSTGVHSTCAITNAMPTGTSTMPTIFATCGGVRCSAAVGYDELRYQAMGTLWLIRETDIEYLRALRYEIPSRSSPG